MSTRPGKAAAVARPAVHVARVGTVTAAVYADGARPPTYRVALARDPGGEAEFLPDELCFVHSAVEQAEYFIRYQEQLARMTRCPGCGDG